MVNPIKLFKQMKSADLDQALELLSSMGVQVELTPIPLEKKPASDELDAIASAAVAEGAKFFRITANHSGNPLTAFVVVGKPVTVIKSS